MFTCVDLFSGIGGFSLAAQWAGFTTIQFVEIDAYCQRVLRKNFPGVPLDSDIKSFCGKRLQGTTDLLTGGFPCQPFSCAGKRLGAKDDRALWPEMFRVITEVQPAWVVGENVAGILNTVEFDSVLSDLEGAGYKVGTFVLPACAVNAPHRRDRVWIIAHAPASGRRKKQPDLHQGQPNAKGRVAPHPDHFDGRAKPQNRRGSAGVWGEPARGAAGDADHAGRGEQRGGSAVPAEFSTLERADWRAVEPLLCRGDHGIPHRVDRLRGLGNAIVPQVAYAVLKAIADQLRSQRKDTP